MNLILSETNRSLIYLKYLIKNKIFFKNIIYYSPIKKKLYSFLKKKSLDHKTYFIKTKNINSHLIQKKIEKLDGDFLYSGYPSGIIKNKKILNKKVFHCHPGDISKFKGSTVIFYALALKEKITVTLFRLSDKIDEGEIFYKKKFYSKPKNEQLLNNSYDDEVRAKTLVEFFKRRNKLKKYDIIKNKYNSYYYIAHPVIRGIVLNKNFLKKLYQKNK